MLFSAVLQVDLCVRVMEAHILKLIAKFSFFFEAENPRKSLNEPKPKQNNHNNSECKLHCVRNVHVSQGNLCITRASAKLFTH